MSSKLLSILEQVDTEMVSVNYELQPMPSNDEIVQAIVADQEDFPINFTLVDNELICMVRLFDESEISEASKNELHEVMLTGNMALPLSSFGKVGDTYMLFGALSANSKAESIGIEIETLAGNTLEALELVEEYLN